MIKPVEVTLEAIRDAYASAVADDQHWHYEDFVADVAVNKEAFDRWLEDHDDQIRVEVLEYIKNLDWETKGNILSHAYPHFGLGYFE